VPASLLNLVDGVPSIGEQGTPGHERRVIGKQKERRTGNLGGLSHAFQRMKAAHDLVKTGIMMRQLSATGSPPRASKRA